MCSKDAQEQIQYSACSRNNTVHSHAHFVLIVTLIPLMIKSKHSQLSHCCLPSQAHRHVLFRRMSMCSQCLFVCCLQLPCCPKMTCCMPCLASTLLPFLLRMATMCTVLVQSQDVAEAQKGLTVMGAAGRATGGASAGPFQMHMRWVSLSVCPTLSVCLSICQVQVFLCLYLICFNVCLSVCSSIGCKSSSAPISFPSRVCLSACVCPCTSVFLPV